MRGGYPLALPLLSAWRIGSALALGRRAAGYYSRFAAEHDDEVTRNEDSIGSARV